MVDSEMMKKVGYGCHLEMFVCLTKVETDSPEKKLFREKSVASNM
jgi:hypothetical protein